MGRETQPAWCGCGWQRAEPCWRAVHNTTQELLEFRWSQSVLDRGTNMLIPVKGTDGAIAIGQETVVFLGPNTVVSTTVDPVIIKVRV